MTENRSPPTLSLQKDSPGTLLVRISGNWRTTKALPGAATIRQSIEAEPDIKTVEFDVSALETWDSRFVAFAGNCRDLCAEHQIEFRGDGLPAGVRGLLRLASAVPEVKGARRENPPTPFLATVGERAIQAWADGLNLFTFLGEVVQALGILFRGRAQFRASDMWVVVQETGPQALGIVALINFLIGLILAFVGSTALAQFGATIYIADMVAIGTTREMGCIMTGIIVCGRTGAAFAAQLGTMKVNEEIGALRTFGISPMEFLVLPRMLALLMMMPLLVVFADLISISGGLFVSVVMLDVTSTEYLTRTVHAVHLKSFLLGIFKGTFFGFLIAYTGCLRGMQCGTNAAAVGQATTRAVVAGITAIIASDGVFALICNALHI